MSLAQTLILGSLPLAFQVVASQRLSILIFHSVPAEPDPLAPDTWPASVFEEQMARMKSTMNVLPLAVAIERLREGRLPPRAVSITFDDGYRDNAEVAAPILKRLGLHATFFVADGFLDGGRMFNDTVIETVRRLPPGKLELPAPLEGSFEVDGDASRHRLIRKVLGGIKYLPFAERDAAVARFCALAPGPLPDSLMMSREQVAGLAADGFEVGGHTVDHPILARLDPAQASEQIARNKRCLEDIVGRPLRLFAYPNGRPGTDYLGVHRKMVEDAGYTAAVSTSRGAADRSSDLFQLPRFTPWNLRPGWFEAQMLRNTFTRASTVTAEAN
jgi:peptidoglycan/xylan/chitin deacetylase (PgdA/CDA1 family)